MHQRLFSLALAAFIAGTSYTIAPAAHALSDAGAIAVQRATSLDRTGKKRLGKASYYHRMFSGRKMADGTRFDPTGTNAASTTLPLGTRAKVTNPANGRSAIVVIKDRGPYVGGRIIDLSPKTAKDLGILEQGVAPVEVAPITVPLPDGTVLAGAAAADVDVVATTRRSVIASVEGG